MVICMQNIFMELIMNKLEEEEREFLELVNNVPAFKIIMIIFSIIIIIIVANKL